MSGERKGKWVPVKSKRSCVEGRVSDCFFFFFLLLDKSVTMNQREKRGRENGLQNLLMPNSRPLTFE